MSEEKASYHAGVCLRVYMNEIDTWQGEPFYRALFALLQREGVSGVTVLRGIEGFGPAHHLTTERLPDIADDLPIIIEIVERPENAARLVSLLDTLVQHGTIVQIPIMIVDRKTD
ncbi:MAG TPA: DUF190 domain-containing protein [Ktedonobacteraceae bacterium]|jgi:PII-like signaling protein|nr:DUF190 domain-containing protein [Ktedonobacteraceae bacterium]